MKKLLVILCSALHFCIASAAPVNIVLPVPPGGAFHKLGLSLSEYLSENGVENIVTYHPGANGEIGLAETLRLKDNVIFGVAWAFAALNPVVNEKPATYNETLEFVAAPLVSVPLGFVSSNKNFKTLPELVSYAKTNPVPCGIIAAYGFLELTEINAKYGTQFEPIYYKGNSQIRTDLVEGSLKCAYDSLGSHVPLHEAKRIIILSTAKAMKDLNVPLTSTVFKEVGRSSNWYGFGIPKNSNLLKDERFMTLVKAFSKSKKLEELSNSPGYTTETPDPNINKIMEKQTAYYRQIYIKSK
jgi:tripartite-type tricarboxylate transporter receptor subunit TctC